MDESESKPGTATLVSEILEIIQGYIMKMQYHSGLSQAIVFNQQKCKGYFICRKAYYQSVGLRRELFRQTASILDNLLDSNIWKFLEVVTVSWCAYLVCYGIIIFVIRLKGSCTKKKLDLSCLQLFLTFFHN